MNQKRNKIIFAGGVIFILFLFILNFWRYFSNPEHIYSKLISQCEASLEKTNSAGVIPPQKICKIENNKIKILETPEEMSSEIHPEDTVIISVNLNKILSRQLYNVYNGQNISKPLDNQGVFCFVIYPVLLEQYMANYNTNIYQNFYSQYLWKIYPKNILNMSSKGDNYICTKLYPFSNYQKISALIKIPSQKDLSLGYKDTHSYGLKIVMAPDDLKHRLLNSKDVFDNYDRFSPIYLFIKFINFNH